MSELEVIKVQVEKNRIAIEKLAKADVELLARLEARDREILARIDGTTAHFDRIIRDAVKQLQVDSKDRVREHIEVEQRHDSVVLEGITGAIGRLEKKMEDMAPDLEWCREVKANTKIIFWTGGLIFAAIVTATVTMWIEAITRV